MNYLIVHGTNGSPQSNWFPWLKTELEEKGHTVIVPVFPTPEGQNLNNWLAVAQAALAGLKESETVLIGHSMGATLVLHLAERTAQPFQAVCSVCPFFCLLGSKDFDPLIKTFVDYKLDWRKARAGAKAWHVFASDNDPYVPLPVCQDVADQLGVKLTIVRGGKHLNANAGYTAFPELLAALDP